jgi:phosphatidylethanolamine/phosphatidyl-N-methylethanolamine N-methyltransferase
MAYERVAPASGRSIFVRHWLRNPLGMGALLPSSPSVARALAGQMQLGRDGPILELGAGTGTITAGLVGGGCAQDRLVLVESEPRLTEHLREHYPATRAICGDATEIDSILSEIGVDRLATVVSSLPIKWFSLDDQRATVMPCLRRLGPGGYFVQITNAPTSPIDHRRLCINAERVDAVWLHFLPVQVWRYWLD